MKFSEAAFSFIVSGVLVTPLRGEKSEGYIAAAHRCGYNQGVNND